jgi:hypothetical protein
MITTVIASAAQQSNPLNFPTGIILPPVSSRALDPRSRIFKETTNIYYYSQFLLDRGSSPAKTKITIGLFLLPLRSSVAAKLTDEGCQ